MRHLGRNKTTVHFLNYVSSTDVVDGDGNPTGERKVNYSDPIELKAAVMSSSGMVSIGILGADVQYDKLLYVSKSDATKFDENSVFFVDKAVEYDSNKKPLFDYRVKKKAPLVNEAVIGLVKVGYSK